MCKNKGTDSFVAKAQGQTLKRISYGTLGKSLIHSEPQFPQLLNANIKMFLFHRNLRRISWLRFVNHFEIFWGIRRNWPFLRQKPIA